jgi:hypothetical protein
MIYRSKAKTMSEPKLQRDSETKVATTSVLALPPLGMANKPRAGHRSVVYQTNGRDRVFQQ